MTKADTVELNLDEIPMPPEITSPADQVNCRLSFYYPYKGGYDEGKLASYDLKRALPSWAIDIGQLWFFQGLGNVVQGEELHFRGRVFVPKEGTLRETLHRIAPFCGSWDPSHEQKAAMVGFLFYRLFKEKVDA
jgi:hypothetical protein